MCVTHFSYKIYVRPIPGFSQMCVTHFLYEIYMRLLSGFSQMYVTHFSRCRGGSDRFKKMLDLGGDRFWHPQRVLCQPYGEKKNRAGDFFLNAPKCCKMLQKHDFSNIFGRRSYNKCSIGLKFGMDKLEDTDYVYTKF